MRSEQFSGPGGPRAAARRAVPVLLTAILLLAPGCSIKRMALRQVGNALAAGGTTFASDNDPELVRDAVPFSLKLMESVLAELPDHQGLLLAAASGFAQYSYAFVQQDADRLREDDLEASEALKARARKLYLRGRDYGLRGLETRHRGFGASLRGDVHEAVQAARRKDVPLLYWTAVAWAAAISVSKDDPALIGDQPVVEALIDRALELQEDFDQGAIHSFLIAYEMARQGAQGDPAQRARAHLDRALELSGGRLAGPLVTYAESVCVPRQNKAEFEQLLGRALAVDPDAAPESRLVNLVMQGRARWLLERKDELFFEPKAE